MDKARTHTLVVRPRAVPLCSKSRKVQLVVAMWPLSTAHLSPVTTAGAVLLCPGQGDCTSTWGIRSGPQALQKSPCPPRKIPSVSEESLCLVMISGHTQAASQVPAGIPGFLETRASSQMDPRGRSSQGTPKESWCSAHEGFLQSWGKAGVGRRMEVAGTDVPVWGGHFEMPGERDFSCLNFFHLRLRDKQDVDRICPLQSSSFRRQTHPIGFLLASPPGLSKAFSVLTQVGTTHPSAPSVCIIMTSCNVLSIC